MVVREKSTVLTFVASALVVGCVLASSAAANDGFRWASITQTVKFRRITTEDGLSQSSVSCILQDREGYIWFGTEDGLNKYDGYDFTVSRPDPDDPYSISSNRIFSLFEDHEGTLWIGTNGGGLVRFDRQTGRYFSFRNDDESEHSISDDNIYTIYEDRSGKLWLGTLGGGLNRLIPPDQVGDRPTFEKLKHDPDNARSITHNNVRAIFQDMQGVLWIGTDAGGLDQAIPGAHPDSQTLFVHHGEALRVPGEQELPAVMAMVEDNHGVLWIGTDNGLYCFDQERLELTRFNADPDDPHSLSHGYVRRLLKDSSGAIWVGTDGGGLNKLVPGETAGAPLRFRRYQYSALNPDGLSNDAVESIHEDRSGILWIGLYNSGINKLILRDTASGDREAEQFMHLHLNSRAPEHGLSHNAVNAISEDPGSGSLYVGTDGGGLNVVVPGRPEEEPLRFIHHRSVPGDPGSLSNDNITSLFVDHAGQLWIGTYTGGLNRMIPGEGGDSDSTFVSYRHDPRDPNSLSHSFVYAIHEDSDNLLWIATMGGGVNSYDPESDTFSHYRSNPDQPDSLSIDYVTTVLADSTDLIWIGTTYGLNRYDKVTRSYTHCFNDPDRPDSLSSDYVSTIFEDSSGELWFGTDGGGLNKLVSARDQDAPLSFARYTTKDGLPSNVISNILEDNQADLWLTTNKGICSFDRESGVVRSYDVNDGLQSNEFNEGAAWINRYGEMFLGGNNGVSIFHPDGLRRNTHVPPIKITDLRVFNQSVPVGEWKDGLTILKKAIDETEEIELPHNLNIFSFQFAALDFVSPGKNEYAYMLEGLETEWNDVGSRRYVTYTTLPAGDYLFRVKGSNNDGVWNEEGISVKVRIKPPFWLTSWFLSLAAIFVATTATLIYRARTREIKSRARQAEQANLLLNRQIDERKRAEEALRASETKYRRLYTGIPDPILLYSRETRQLLDCNEAAVERYGYSLEELQSMTLDDLEEPGEGPFRVHTTSTGETLQVEVHSATMEYLDRWVDVAIIRDVTQQKLLEEQLHQAQKLESIGQLAGGIAHDFNNMLTAVRGHAELVLLKMKEESEARRCIEAILSAAKRASNLTSQLLAFSRKQIIQPKVIEVNTIISDLDIMLRRLIDEDIVIERRYRSDTLVIEADQGQIEQVLVNLILNARDAINDNRAELRARDEEKRIIIETDETYLDGSLDVEAGQYVSIAISDNGIGMDRATREKVFEPFFSTKSMEKGTGLGMSTVYGVVKQNLGAIDIDSEPLHGTTIKIFWPAIELQELQLSEQVDRPAPTGGSETILFVEDDPDVREFAVSALREFGYTVVEADTGRVALELLRNGELEVDLLITDIVMPEMNGIELAARYRTIHPGSPIIYSTGHTDAGDVSQAQAESDEIQLLLKPYSIDYLLEKIKEALQGQS
jgi:ligand-binding sensor domain-containing protein/signal transduction histidine kinase/ActR/RegA family two-component response regulator